MEQTIATINPPNTQSSIIEELTSPCASGDHFPGSLACEDSNVITRTRRIDAIRPTIRKGSQTSAPSLNETRTV